MEHGRKMIVIPQELLERLQSPTSGHQSSPEAKRSYKSLDDEMEEIMNNKKIEDSEKWKLYNQVLQRFLNIASNKRKPVNLPIVNNALGEEILEEQEDEGAVGHQQPIQQQQQQQQRTYPGQIEEIVETFSTSYKSDARNLLRYISRDGSLIRWNETFEVFVDGTHIPKSNLVDLMHSIIRVRMTDKVPIGWVEVMEALKRMNAPRGYIHNRKASNYLDGMVTSTPNRSFSTEEMSESTGAKRKTPMVDRLRSAAVRRLQHTQQYENRHSDIKQSPIIKSLDNWEPYTP